MGSLSLHPLGPVRVGCPQQLFSSVKPQTLSPEVRVGSAPSSRPLVLGEPPLQLHWASPFSVAGPQAFFTFTFFKKSLFLLLSLPVTRPWIKYVFNLPRPQERETERNIDGNTDQLPPARPCWGPSPHRGLCPDRDLTVTSRSLGQLNRRATLARLCGIFLLSVLQPRVSLFAPENLLD